MKKLFTFKNILIVLFLLSIVAYVSADTASRFDTLKMYNNWIEMPSFSSESLKSDIARRNTVLFIIITNFLMITFIISFLILFCFSLFKNFRYLKLSFISLIFICFILYMSQLTTWYLITMCYVATIYNATVDASSLAIGITSLICILISIHCYVYLLLKEIKKRKAVATESTEQVDPQKPTTIEPIQD